MGYEVQEGRDEQIGILLHYKNLTLEIALVLRFANIITYSNEYNLAIAHSALSPE